MTLRSLGGFFPVIFIWCWRRGWNHVPIWGKALALLLVPSFRSLFRQSLNDFHCSEWTKHGWQLWLPPMYWSKSKATQRGWTFILLVVPQWYNWSRERLCYMSGLPLISSVFNCFFLSVIWFFIYIFKVFFFSFGISCEGVRIWNVKQN